ncbi:MAG: ABC transporter permease, partial [Deltaproteobacteria bacterium]|nr:ABC transporter permease [Deltaproteobacteria bacterium]
MTDPAPNPGPGFRIQENAAGPWKLSGALTARTEPRTWDFLQRLKPGQKIVLDLADLEALDLNGAAQLYWAMESAKTRGAQVETQSIREDFLPIWNLTRDTLGLPKTLQKPPKNSLLEELGQTAVFMYRDLTAMIFFLGEMISHFFALVRRPWTGRWAMILQIAETAVVNSLPVTCLVAFLVGLILAFQSAMFMKMFGVEIFVADLVGLAMIRELGSLMTAIVLTGRTGSAFSAELGSMKTNQEIDAFLTMGLNPVRDLALPRAAAMTIATPLLAVLANFSGLLGGNLVMISMGFPVRVFWDELASHIDASDISTGLFKAFVFGFTVAAIGCQRGLAAGSGPEAVGQSTTLGVVTNIIVIAFLDSLFAVLFYVLSW